MVLRRFDGPREVLWSFKEVWYTIEVCVPASGPTIPGSNLGPGGLPKDRSEGRTVNTVQVQ